MTLKEEYDIWHQRVFESDPTHNDASSPWYELVRKRLGNINGLRVLEIACGRGSFAWEMATMGANVTGCDFSGSAMAIAKAKSEWHLSDNFPVFVQGDAQNLPFADQSFDLVVSCETIEHVPDVEAALREFWRIARHGGRLLLTTPNYVNLMGLYDLYTRVRRGRKDDQPFDRRQSFLQVRGWVEGAGWKITHSDGSVHQLPIFPGHNPISLSVLEANHIVRRLLSPFAYHYFLVCEKAAAA